MDEWGLILAQGADAAAFLHGQLTQDVAHLEASQVRLAGYCSAKGRLLATFLIWRRGGAQALDMAAPIAMACSADVLQATLKRLSMFVLRARCRLSDVSAATALYGLAGPSADAWARRAAGLEDAASGAVIAPWTCLHAGGADLIRLPDAQGLARWLLAQPAEAPPPALAPLPRGVWDWLEVRAGVPRVGAATAEHFVPQMVNLELTGGVHFQKGCYPGQEVVARSQYRGTLKRRMLLARADGALRPGQEVVHDQDPGQPAGEVVLAAPEPPWVSSLPIEAAGAGAAEPAAQGAVPALHDADGVPSQAHAVLLSLKTELLQVPGTLRAGDVGLVILDELPYSIPPSQA